MIGFLSGMQTKGEGGGLFTDDEAQVIDAVARDDSAYGLAAGQGQGDFGVDRAIVDTGNFAPKVGAAKFL